MRLSRLHHLSRWGSAALALSLLSTACSTSRSSSEPRDLVLPAQAAGGPVRNDAPPAPAEAVATKEAIDFQDDTVEGELARPEPLAVAQPKPAPEKARAEASRTAPARMKAPMTPPPPPPTGAAGVKRDMYVAQEPPSSGNTFTEHAPNAFTQTAEDRLSTFAVDVDTASYTVARRYLSQGALPPHAAVRVEEFVNYFKYRYTPPEQGAFTVHLEGAPSPFNPGRHFLRVGVQGKVVSRSQRKPAHLVFLVDTSGSMQSPDRLPLAQEAMKIAVKNLNENDTVAIVTYAGSTRDVLSPTPATDVQRIHTAIDSLSAGGGTAMGSGMELAYKHAVKRASANVVSRVIVLTDGDANIGPNVGADAMLASIQKYVAEGVTLSTIGFGMGNYRDDLMERLANKGNGNCYYIDGYKEAKKVFETQLTGTLEVIAKDVKLQVEFDPRRVRRYRLLGYENRNVADQDFRNDKVDAGEIGAGHSVTAVYEVELTGEPSAALGTVFIRAKTPSGTEASEQRFPFESKQVRTSLDAASADFRFALAVAASADILRASPAAQGWSMATAQKLAEGALEGQSDRAEFAKLVASARSLLGSTVAHGSP